MKHSCKRLTQVVLLAMLATLASCASDAVCDAPCSTDVAVRIVNSGVLPDGWYRQ